MHRFTKSRSRKVVTATAALFLAVVTSAVAYYIIQALSGEGSGSAKLGTIAEGSPRHESSNIPIKVTFAAGLQPGHNEPVSIAWENNTSQTAEISKVVVTPETGVAGCEPSWFSVRQETSIIHENNMWAELLKEGLNHAEFEPIRIPAGGTYTSTAGVLHLLFEEVPGNQDACSGATLTLKVTSTP